VLSSELRGRTEVLREVCAARGGLPISSPVVAGRGGLPQDPASTLRALLSPAAMSTATRRQAPAQLSEWRSSNHGPSGNALGVS
jgi:hypothetical protein